MSIVTARALPTHTFVALIWLIGLIAPGPNTAAADLPQHIPVQGLASAAGDFAEFSIEAQFGHAVAIRNGVAFMGMPLAQESTGRVAVFTQTTTGWRRTATLVAPTSGSDRHFGRTITFRDGVVVIGSDTAAYVFRRGNGKFNYVQKLAPPAADRAVEFPMALRYEAGTLFASAYRGGALPSIVYIFEVDSTGRFVPRGKLTGPANELFGADLSMARTTLVVGSPGGRSRLRQFGLFHHGPGSAYVFKRDSSGRWRQTQRLVATRTAGGFGSAVAIDRGMIIVGAPQEAIEGGSRGEPTLDNHIAGGAAYVFVPTAGTYVETLRLRPRPDERIQYMDYGHRIAMFDDKIVITAVQPYGEVDHVVGGFAFTYSREGANVVARGIAAGHSVAYSIGLFHNLLLVGSPGADRCADIFGCSGTARIYDVSRVTRSALPLTYRMTHVVTDILDGPFDSLVQVRGMNDKGEVVGSFPTHSFVWRDGTFETLSLPEGRGQPIAINDRSQIAANCLTGFNTSYVCLRLNDEFSHFEVPNESWSSVRDLSNGGHVLGITVSLDQKVTQFVGHSGKFTVLDPLPGFPETLAMRMNDRGTIVVGNGSGVEGNQGPWMPVLWQSGTIMPLGRPPGFSSLLALDVNDGGMVIFNPAHTWQEGNFTRLGPPDGRHLHLVPATLNNQGIVTGSADESSGGVVSGVVATLWLEGPGTNINWLISGADPLRPFVQSQDGIFINDRNQLLVGGADSRNPGVSYYLLSPIGLQQ